MFLANSVIDFQFFVAAHSVVVFYPRTLLEAEGVDCLTMT